MDKLKIIPIILWIIVGILVLILRKEVTKLEYGLVWITLVIKLMENLVK